MVNGLRSLHNVREVWKWSSPSLSWSDYEYCCLQAISWPQWQKLSLLASKLRDHAHDQALIGRVHCVALRRIVNRQSQIANRKAWHRIVGWLGAVAASLNPFHFAASTALVLCEYEYS